MAGSRRVLVVDDDEPIADLLSTVLGEEGYEVRVVGNGREALAVVHWWRPDLILLDLVMRDMDGWAFRAEQRRNGFADLPVLLVTAANHVDADAEALAAPVLSKPFDLDELLRRVECLLSRGAAEADGLIGAPSYSARSD